MILTTSGKTAVYRFSHHGNLQKPLLQLLDGRLVRMRGPDYVFYEFEGQNVFCWAVWLRKISFGIVVITKSVLKQDSTWKICFQHTICLERFCRRIGY